MSELAKQNQTKVEKRLRVYKVVWRIAWFLTFFIGGMWSASFAYNQRYLAAVVVLLGAVALYVLITVMHSFFEVRLKKQLENS